MRDESVNRRRIRRSPWRIAALPQSPCAEQGDCQDDSRKDQQHRDQNIAFHLVRSANHHTAIRREITDRQWIEPAKRKAAIPAASAEGKRGLGCLPFAKAPLRLNDVEETDADIPVPPHRKCPGDAAVLSGAAGDRAG